jgi:hypothetical protein
VQPTDLEKEFLKLTFDARSKALSHIFSRCQRAFVSEALFFELQRLIVTRDTVALRETSGTNIHQWHWEWAQEPPSLRVLARKILDTLALERWQLKWVSIDATDVPLREPFPAEQRVAELFSAIKQAGMIFGIRDLASWSQSIAFVAPDPVLARLAKPVHRGAFADYDRAFREQHRLEAKPIRLQPVLDTDRLGEPSASSVWKIRLQGLIYLLSGLFWWLAHVSLLVLGGFLSFAAFSVVRIAGMAASSVLGVPSIIGGLTSAVLSLLFLALVALFLLISAEVIAWLTKPHSKTLGRTLAVTLAKFRSGTLPEKPPSERISEKASRNAIEWRRYGHLAWRSARRLAAQSAYVDELIERRRPFVLLLRDWRSNAFGAFSKYNRFVDASPAARWARVAASVLPVVALAEPDTLEVPGIVSPAVPRAGWERMVERLVPAAQSILLVVENGSLGGGLDWEIKHLTVTGQLSKALLVVYGDFPRSADFSLVLRAPKFSSYSDASVDEAMVDWIRTSDPEAIRRLDSLQKRDS